MADEFERDRDRFYELLQEYGIDADEFGPVSPEYLSLDDDTGWTIFTFARLIEQIKNNAEKITLDFTSVKEVFSKSEDQATFEFADAINNIPSHSIRNYIYQNLLNNTKSKVDPLTYELTNESLKQLLENDKTKTMFDQPLSDMFLIKDKDLSPFEIIVVDLSYFPPFLLDKVNVFSTSKGDKYSVHIIDSNIY